MPRPRPTSPSGRPAAASTPAPRALRQSTLPFAAAGPSSSKKAAGGAKARGAPPSKKLLPPPGRLDLGAGAALLYLPAHFPAGAADALLAALRSEVDWEQRDVTVWGRTVPQRRLVAYQAGPGSRAPYTYSGLTLAPSPFSPAVAAVKAAVEAVAGCAFDTALLNLYRDGADAMAWHADGEALYGPPPTVIGSASFGVARAFQLRPTPGGRAEGRPDLPATRIEYALGHGDVLVMSGTTQRDWQHAVPPRCFGGVRVNLTFRATAAFKAREAAAGRGGVPALKGG